MLIKTKIDKEQKYVKISEPSMEEFLKAGKPSLTHYCIKSVEDFLIHASVAHKS